jgi:hypothetical protein
MMLCFSKQNFEIWTPVHSHIACKTNLLRKTKAIKRQDLFKIHNCKISNSTKKKIQYGHRRSENSLTNKYFPNQFFLCLICEQTAVPRHVTSSQMLAHLSETCFLLHQAMYLRHLPLIYRPPRLASSLSILTSLSSLS